MKIRNVRPHSAWDMAYDFLNDIFAALVPGSFFLSYFLFMAVLIAEHLQALGEFVEKLGVIFPLMVVALAYSFGAFFQRREIKTKDQASAKHIYRKMPHSSGHSFAFANALPDAYLTKICRLMEYWWIEAEAGPGITAKVQTRLTKISDILTAYLKGSKKGEAGKYAKYILEKLLLIECDNKTHMDSQLRKLHKAIWKKERKTLKESVEAEVYLNGAIAQSATFEALPLAARARARLHFCLIKHRLRFQCRKGVKPKKAGPHTEKVYPYAEVCRKRLISAMPVTLSGGTEMIQARNNYQALKKIHKALAEVNQLICIVQPALKGEGEAVAARRLSHLQKIQKYVDHDLHASIDWPYTNMKRYCGDRGLDFKDEVTWGDGAVTMSVVDEMWLTTDNRVSDEIKRSKVALNTEKMRIALAEPELSRVISRNEAHIRYISSIWYATHLVLPVSLLFLLISVLLGIAIWTKYPLDPFIHEWMKTIQFGDPVKIFFLSLFYIMACICITRSGREILHYQRVREITMLLQAVYIINGKEKTGDSAEAAAAAPEPELKEAPG